MEEEEDRHLTAEEVSTTGKVNPFGVEPYHDDAWFLQASLPLSLVRAGAAAATPDGRHPLLGRDIRNLNRLANRDVVETGPAQKRRFHESFIRSKDSFSYSSLLSDQRLIRRDCYCEHGEKRSLTNCGTLLCINNMKSGCGRACASVDATHFALPYEDAVNKVSINIATALYMVIKAAPNLLRTSNRSLGYQSPLNLDSEYFCNLMSLSGDDIGVYFMIILGVGLGNKKYLATTLAKAVWRQIALLVGLTVHFMGDPNLCNSGVYMLDATELTEDKIRLLKKVAVGLTSYGEMVMGEPFTEKLTFIHFGLLMGPADMTYAKDTASNILTLAEQKAQLIADNNQQYFDGPAEKKMAKLKVFANLQESLVIDKHNFCVVNSIQDDLTIEVVHLTDPELARRISNFEVYSTPGHPGVFGKGQLTDASPCHICPSRLCGSNDKAISLMDPIFHQVIKVLSSGPNTVNLLTMEPLHSDESNTQKLMFSNQTWATSVTMSKFAARVHQIYPQSRSSFRKLLIVMGGRLCLPDLTYYRRNGSQVCGTTELEAECMSEYRSSEVFYLELTDPVSNLTTFAAVNFDRDMPNGFKRAAWVVQ